MRLRRFAFVCAIGACVLAACGSNNLGISTATQSAIRFINGSPDLNAAGVDVYLSSTANAASNASPLTYKLATAISYVNSQAYTVIVTPTGNKGTTLLSCATPSLVANTRYTVVIAGKVTPGATPNDGLQCQIFAETIYSLPVGSFELSFHNASPALAAASLTASGQATSGAGFGTFANTTPPVYNSQAGLPATFTAPTSGVANDAVASNVLPAGVLTAPGIGVYTSTVTDVLGDPNPPGPGNVQATLLPSALQAGFSGAIGSTCDPQNTYPIQTPSPTPTPASTTPPTPSPTPSPACVLTSTVMSVYAVDAPAGSGTATALVGVSD
jgi:hypothetical protein